MTEIKGKVPHLTSMVLSTLAISFNPLSSNASGQQSRDRGSIVEREERETQRLINGFLPDGKLGVPTGTEYVTPENISRPIILVLGVRTTPEETQCEAEELAKLTKRAVIPLANFASKQRIEEFLNSADEQLFSLLGVSDGSTIKEISVSINQTTAEALGTLRDGFNAVFDRFAPPELSLEPATDSLAAEIVRRISENEALHLVAHSQGTVICRNAFHLAVSILLDQRESLGLSEQQLKDRLSRAKVVAAGSFVGPGEWNIPAKLEVVNSKDDPISSVAGWNNWFQREGQDFRFITHRFSERYRMQVARYLK